MIIQTERLTIRPIEESDWTSIREIWIDFNNSEYVIYDNEKNTDPDDVKNRIARWAEATRNGTEHMFFVTCLEHGLSTIEQRPYSEREKYQNPNYRWSVRDEICNDIENAFAKKPKNFEELLQLIEATGYEIKRCKQIAVRKRDRKRFVRLDTLEPAYHEQNLRRRLGEEPAEQTEERPRDFNIVLDIQQIIAKNKGANYERWAKRYNMKQVAKSLCFMQEHGIKTMAELTELRDGTSKRFDELTNP